MVGELLYFALVFLLGVIASKTIPLLLDLHIEKYLSKRQAKEIA